MHPIPCLGGKRAKQQKSHAARKCDLNQKSTRGVAHFQAEYASMGSVPAGAVRALLRMKRKMPPAAMSKTAKTTTTMMMVIFPPSPPGPGLGPGFGPGLGPGLGPGMMSDSPSWLQWPVMP